MVAGLCLCSGVFFFQAGKVGAESCNGVFLFLQGIPATMCKTFHKDLYTHCLLNTASRHIEGEGQRDS